MSEEFDKWAQDNMMYGGDKWASKEGWNARQPEIDALGDQLLEEVKEKLVLDNRVRELKAENELLRKDAECRTLSIAEQLVQAKEDNADLVHWENYDPEAWGQAMKQDEILRTTSTWASRPFAERFAEVVRRVRAILPEASTPQ